MIAPHWKCASASEVGVSTVAAAGLAGARCSDSCGASRRQKLCASAALILTLVHAALLAWGAWVHSPGWDEVGHLSAGLAHWRYGSFDLYRVNPPLVRMLATAPLANCGFKVGLPQSARDARERPEFALGRLMFKQDGERTLWWLRIARWSCIPLSLVAAYVCYRWASDLFGAASGLLATALWCFSPMVLGHAQMITADTGAAGMGAAACYSFWRWLKRPSWFGAVIAGGLLGVGELTKFTLVIFYPLWLMIWVAWASRCGARAHIARSSRECAQLVFSLLLSIYVINAGYGFERSCKKLADFTFVSRTFRGADNARGNVFAKTSVGAIRVPLPENYILGIDRQKRDFDDRMRSYLRGEWRDGGWWYYYLYGLAVKAPLGNLALAMLAVLACLARRRYLAPWRDELAVIAPGVVLLVFVSSQTGFNHHLRYILPAFPFAFIAVSRLARSADFGHRVVESGTLVFLMLSTGSSLCHYPHSLSYFNELAGGPKRGPAHLLDSNIDWGQDLLLLREWMRNHPEAQPMRLAYSLPSHVLGPADLGVVCGEAPIDLRAAPRGTALDLIGPQEGWYAVFVGAMYAWEGKYAYFRELHPVDTVGYTVYIYHLSALDAKEMRHRLEFQTSDSRAVR